MPETVPVSELSLGDIVRCFDDGGFGDAIVIRVDMHIVRVYRPYATTSGFSYSGGRTIPYIGSEEFDLPPTSTIVRLRKGYPHR